MKRPNQECKKKKRNRHRHEINCRTRILFTIQFISFVCDPKSKSKFRYGPVMFTHHHHHHYYYNHDHFLFLVLNKILQRRKKTIVDHQ